MDPDARFAKKVRDAAVLRSVAPERSVDMAFELIRVARALHEAASRAPA